MNSGNATPSYAASQTSQFEDVLLKNKSLGQEILPSPGQPKRTESLYVTPGRGGAGAISSSGGGGGGGGGVKSGGGGGGAIKRGGNATKVRVEYNIIYFFLNFD